MFYSIGPRPHQARLEGRNALAYLYPFIGDEEKKVFLRLTPGEMDSERPLAHWSVLLKSVKFQNNQIMI